MTTVGRRDRAPKPTTAPKLEFESVDPPVLARDEPGIVLGGVRLAAVEAPIALNSGENSGATFCVLYGTHQPFDDATLQALCPHHGVYLYAVFRAVLDNLKDRYITLKAALETIAEAALADLPPE